MFWDAYLADTTHLSTEEHGAYLLLLAAMWRRNGWVPDDDRDNARILGLTVAKWKRIKDRLSPFLTFEDGHISQKNLLKIWKNTQEKIAKNRQNGAKGGRPKDSKNNSLTKADGSNSVNPNESIPEPEPEPVEKEEPKGSSKKKGSRLREDWSLPKAWGQWAVDHGMDELSVRREADRFGDYWRGVPGQKGVKLDWQATWRNWIRKSIEERAVKAKRKKPEDGDTRYLDDGQLQTYSAWDGWKNTYV
jgi:uncharacterized protein YdaU (DUF1376 family)